MLYPNIFDTKTPQGRNCSYWNDELWDIALSFRKWDGTLFKGIAPECDNDYLNYILQTRGFAVLARINDKIYGCECGYRGHQYTYLPRIINITNPYIKRELGKSKMITVEVGKDAVFIKNNKSMTPITKTIHHYANILGTITTSMGINLINNRATTIYKVDDGDKANKVRQMVDNIQSGNLAIVGDDDFINSIIDEKTGRLPVISVNNDMIADKYITAIKEIMCQFLAEIGINSSGANMIKKESNTTDEVHSNDQEIEVKRSFWIDPIKLACEQANELFGCDIECNYVDNNNRTEGGAVDEEPDYGEGQEIDN